MRRATPALDPRLMSIVREDRAEEKWCPFAASTLNRLDEGDNHKGPSTGREEDVENPAYARCLGKDCMAWRWASISKRLGFCGLAGTPPDLARSLAKLT